MSLKLLTHLINITVPEQQETLKQQIDAKDWKAAVLTSARLNLNLRDIVALENGTF